MATRRRSRRTHAETPAETPGEAPVRAGPRPIWSGTISFGLVAVPVDLFPATRAAAVTVRLLAPDGAPLQRRYVCPEHEADVPWQELVRGYAIDDEHHVVLTDEELEAVAPRKSRDIDLRRFVPVDDLDPFLFERAYVLTPGGDSSKPYRLIADVMEREGKAGIATFVMRTKEYLVAILARQGILWAETLRFAGELRTPKDLGLPEPATPHKTEVTAFVRAIRGLEKPGLDRDELVDEREHRLLQLIERKQRRDEDVVQAPAAAAEEADADLDTDEAPDLFETIRSSLQLAGDGRRRAASRGGQQRGRRHGQGQHGSRPQGGRRGGRPRAPVNGAAAPRRAASRSASGARRKGRAKGRRRAATAPARSAR